jgi:hypothetical protein
MNIFNHTAEKAYKGAQSKTEKEATSQFIQNTIAVKETLATPGWAVIERYMRSMKEEDENFLKQMPSQAHFSMFAQGGFSRLSKILDFIKPYKK